MLRQHHTTKTFRSIGSHMSVELCATGTNTHRNTVAQRLFIAVNLYHHFVCSPRIMCWCVNGSQEFAPNSIILRFTLTASVCTFSGDALDAFVLVFLSLPRNLLLSNGENGRKKTVFLLSFLWKNAGASNAFVPRSNLVTFVKSRTSCSVLLLLL